MSAGGGGGRRGVEALAAPPAGLLACPRTCGPPASPALRRPNSAPPVPRQPKPPFPPASPSPPSRPKRILVLYGSLRARSYSKLLSYEFARILEGLGCDVRVFDPAGLPLKDDASEGHPKVGRRARGRGGDWGVGWVRLSLCGLGQGGSRQKRLGRLNGAPHAQTCGRLTSPTDPPTPAPRRRCRSSAR